MIGAYIDDELDPSDRGLVELALAESGELRQLHTELVELRKTFQSLPSFALGADFQSRVLERAKQVERAPDRGRVAASHARLGPRRNWSRSLIVATAVAASVLGVFVWNSFDRPDPTVWAGESLVYYQPARHPLSLIFDVTVTPQGQANRAIESVFERAGIGFDPDLMVEEGLEESILKSRVLAEVKPLNDGAEEPEDEVQMTYVVAESSRIDEIWKRIRARQQDFSRPQFDLLGGPDFDLMYRVNESSRVKFANQDSASKTSLAHRLVFRVSLTSARGVKQPSGVEAEELARFAPRGEAAAPLNADGDEVEISEVLFILRYPKPN
jgi:hypothetical protein